jgi:hypothetical protein
LPFEHLSCVSAMGSNQPLRTNPFALVNEGTSGFSCEAWRSP